MQSLLAFTKKLATRVARVLPHRGSSAAHAAATDARNDDLFDVPAEAMSLPGLDAVESASAVSPFATDADEGLEVRSSTRSSGHPRRAWMALGAVASMNVLLLAIVCMRDHRAASSEPGVARAASNANDGAQETTATRSPRASSTAVSTESPPHTANAHSRMHAVETLIESGRRSLARVELGRILLDIDALPESEREAARADAELLAARLLQDAADEARRTAR
jgi:hypothetical protein